MLIAIISDIHGNMDALNKVLADIDAADADQIVCLGDCIGYGAEPEEVVREIIRRNIPTVAGNHEMAVTRNARLEWFNPNARRSLEKTISMLSTQSRDFLRRLPDHRIVAGCRCVHGYPPDSTHTYLFQKGIHELKKTFETMDERICFVGHTHDLEIVRYAHGKVDRNLLYMGETRLEPSHRYIINVGSVGQPRDGNNKAKYVLYDPDKGLITTQFIEYDFASAAAKIIKAGLPRAHAQRLY